jgi:hypothetical protein
MTGYPMHGIGRRFEEAKAVFLATTSQVLPGAATWPRR